MTENNTIATVPAKVLKELSRWCSRGARAKALRDQESVFYLEGWLYATDSYRIARVHVGEHPELDGAVIDPETFDRMTAKDKDAALEAGGVRLGKALIPYATDRKPIGAAAKLFGDRRDDTFDMDFNPAFVADLAKLASATGSKSMGIFSDGGRMRARVLAPGDLAVDALIMPIRR